MSAPRHTGIRPVLVIAAALGLAGHTALAADQDPWSFNAAGHVGLGMRTAGDGLRYHLEGDADLTLAIGGGFGLELGLMGLATDLAGEVDTPHETYGSLVWHGRAVSAGLGVVRPAYDSAVLSPLETMDPVRGLGPDRMASTRSRVTSAAAYRGGLPVGGRISGQSGPVDWSVSAHRMGNAEVAGVAALWRQGDLRVAVAAELASDAAAAGKAAVTLDRGALSMGAALYAAPEPGAENLAEGHVEWAANSRVSYSALLQVGSKAGATLGAVGGSWEIGRAGKLTGTIGAESRSVTAAIGLRHSF